MRTTDRAIRSQSASMDSVAGSSDGDSVVATEEVSGAIVVSTAAGGDAVGLSSSPFIKNVQTAARMPRGEKKKKKTFSERIRSLSLLFRCLRA